MTYISAAVKAPAGLKLFGMAPGVLKNIYVKKHKIKKDISLSKKVNF